MNGFYELRFNLPTVLPLLLSATLLLPSDALRAENIAPTLRGEALAVYLQEHYRPTATLNYGAARERMFQDIDNVDGRVRCVYTGVEITANDIPDGTVMNTEHTWPQSKFQKRLPMKADLHHLFATLSQPNGARGNNPFAEIPDGTTTAWWIRATAETAIPATTARDRYSESTTTRFEPREDHKGNAARAMFYVWTIYRNDDITPDFIDGQTAELARWHREDPVDGVERSRNQAIADFQGNENPFVTDPSLVERLLGTTTPLVPSAVAARMPKTSPKDALGDGTKPVTFDGKHRFADFGFLPPPGLYEGRVFRLSQSYPAQLPDSSRLPEFLKIDFQKDWKAYILGVRDYCFAGNILGSDVEDDFNAAQLAPDRWFHMPWQHFGPGGREGVHGLTREAPVQPRQLAWTQTSAGQTYAVAFYNEFGGFTIEEVWRHRDPQGREQPGSLHNVRFPHGTVVFKLLFVDIPTREVPSLTNPVQWQAYVTETFTATRRKLASLALIQMDVMVRDDRSPHGWVFGTFQYNGALKRVNRWENLVPVGLQWGNDPDVTTHSVNLQPVATERNPRLKETVINDNDDELPPTHLGWGGRLNGPVDNPMSSCMSCHAVAQIREKSPISPLFQEKPPTPGSKEWMRWFQNYQCGERFDAEVPSADFSLQLAISVQNYLRWRGEEQGVSAANYEHLAKKAKASVVDDKYVEVVNENGTPKIAPRNQRNFTP